MDANFPDVVLRPGGGGSRRCRVLFSYSPQNDDELELNVNDEIDFLDEVEEGWWRGKLRNKTGVFPSNFVCEVAGVDESFTSEGEVSAPLSSPDSATTLDDAPVLPPKPMKETCRVLFAYDAANEDELTLKKDEIITIVTKDVEDKGWWKGELRGKVGLFPDNFVEIITSSEEVGSNQQKPDRPSKTFERIDSKIPLFSTPNHKKSQDNINHADQEDKIAGLKNEGPFNKKNIQNSEKNKQETPGIRFTDRNLDLFQIKPDTVASHRKSLESKSNENQSPPVVGKKPILPPPVSNKPRPTPGKSNQVKRLSGEINDLVDGALSKSTSSQVKRLSGDIHDLVDGALSSKLGKQMSGGVKSEELDFDSVERSDMLTHITASRPKAPGRRPPSKEAKENDVHSPLTNGNLENSDKDKTQREREWEKHKPPWVEELKSNLKSTKSPPGENKLEKKTPSSASLKSTQLSTEVTSTNHSSSATTAEMSKSTNSVTTRQHVTQRAQSVFSESSTKISELSSRFSGIEKARSITSTSPPKTVEHPRNFNSVSDQPNDDGAQISKKEFLDLTAKVEKLEKLVVDLETRLRLEFDKRRVIEKELSKLTDLVTQV